MLSAKTTSSAPKPAIISCSNNPSRLGDREAITSAPVSDPAPASDIMIPNPSAPISSTSSANSGAKRCRNESPNAKWISASVIAPRIAGVSAA